MFSWWWCKVRELCCLFIFVLFVFLSVVVIVCVCVVCYVCCVCVCVCVRVCVCVCVCVCAPFHRFQSVDKCSVSLRIFPFASCNTHDLCVKHAQSTSTQQTQRRTHISSSSGTRWSVYFHLDMRLYTPCAGGVTSLFANKWHSAHQTQLEHNTVLNTQNDWQKWPNQTTETNPERYRQYKQQKTRLCYCCMHTRLSERENRKIGKDTEFWYNNKRLHKKSIRNTGRVTNAQTDIEKQADRQNV